MAAGYIGIKSIHLKTFTNAYVPLNAPWHWNANCLQPMEFVGEIKNDGGGFYPLAFGARVFDSGAISINGGYFTAKYGPLGTGTVNNNFGNILWKRTSPLTGILAGWVFGVALTETPLFFDVGTFNVDQTVATFSASYTFTISGVNSDCPNAFSSSNWYDGDGFIYCSWTQTNVQQYMDIPPFSGGGSVNVRQLGNTICAFNSGKFFICAVPYNGLTYVWCESGSTATKTLLLTDFVGTAFNSTPHLQNPSATSIDLDAYINDIATPSPEACYDGFLWMNMNTLVVDGKTLQGFGIYVKPDFSFYQILEIVPVDAYAPNWNTGIGTVQGKFDDNGALWLHNVNSATDIFVSAALPRTIIETFPPVKLPTPPADSDRQLTLYERNTG